MRHRRLGSSGLMVSELAYGNWLTHASQIDEDRACACVHAALDSGITTFDTADAYAGTRAEMVLGKALAGQRREGLEICTKTFWPTGPGTNDRGLSRKHIIESCEASLRRLGVDYLDLYQAHRFDPTTPLEETLRAFDDLVTAGKVLYVGVSEWSAARLEQAAGITQQLRLRPIVSNQPQYSMLWRVIESQVVPVSQSLGIGQIVWSPLAQGVLTGKYRSGADIPVGSRAAYTEGANFIRRWLRDDVLAGVARLEPIAADNGLSTAQLALAWVLNQPGISAAIIGATRPEQIAENVKAVGIELDQGTLDAVDSALGDVVIRDPSLTVDVDPRSER